MRVAGALCATAMHLTHHHHIVYIPHAIPMHCTGDGPAGLSPSPSGRSSSTSAGGSGAQVRMGLAVQHASTLYTASAACHAAHLPADRVQTLHATVHATNLAWYWSWLIGRLWALCVGSQGLAQIQRENQLLRQELDQANRLLAAPDRPALDAALASGLKVAAMLGCAGFVC